MIKSKEIAENGFRNFAQHVNPSLYAFLQNSGQNPQFVRSEGLYLHTSDGKIIEDWMAFWGSQNFGHNNPRVSSAIRQAMESSIPSLYSDAVNPYAGIFAKKIIDLINSLVGEKLYETVFFTNSGTEAVECSIKMSIAGTGRRKILYCEGGYHGTTMGSLSIMAKGGFRDYLEPLLPEFVEIPYNDPVALEAALKSEEFAALIMEPIQIEAGVRAATQEFLSSAEKLCKRYGTYLIIDEIQTGMHRSGDFVRFNVAGIRPDMFLLGKSLAGGMIGAGACIAKEGIFQKAFPDYMTAELHFSTFAGSPLACAGGIETFDLIKEDKFIDNRKKLEVAMKEQFSRIESHPVVESARLYGVMGGITVKEIPTSFHWKDYGVDDDTSVTTGPFLAKKLLEKQIFIRLCAHNFNTLRVQPPLVIDPSLCESFGNRVLEALDEIQEDAKR